MAGSYADIPATRFALDQDGTICQTRDYTAGGPWTDISDDLPGSQVVSYTSYLVGAASTGNSYSEFAFAFPEARDIDGIWIMTGASISVHRTQNPTWEYSTDTSDGTDGSWTSFSVTQTQFTSYDQTSESGKPYYRSDLGALSLSAVTGLRLRFNGSHGSVSHYLATVHVYGSRPASGVDRLAFWDPVTDQAANVAHLDFGDHPQGSSTTRQLRLKNLSATLTANSINLAVSDLASEFSGNLQVSADDSTYLSIINLGSLNQSTVSSVFYVRRNVGAGASLTQRSARLLASADSWS